MLSVVITAWNEATNLPRSVKSVKAIADEIIVVDTESTDDTVSVAKKLGCKVYSHPNTGIVEPVRNFSISKAKYEWILLLDADEEVSETLQAEIKHQMEANSHDVVLIPRKNLIFGSWIQTGHWWPDYVYRLFKRGSLAWKPEIHSIPETKGEVFHLPAEERNSLTHHHYETVSQFVERMNRYTDVQAKQLHDSGVKFVWTDVIAKPFDEFFSQYFSRHGYQYQLHGLSLSLLQAASSLVLYLKLWQLDKFSPTEVSLVEASSLFHSKAKEYEWWIGETRIQSLKGPAKHLAKLSRKVKQHV